MKSFKQAFLMLIPLLAIFYFLSCGEQDIGEFQENTYHEYEFNTVVDDYEALHDLVFSLTLEDVTKSTVHLIKNNRPAYDVTQFDIRKMLLHEGYPAQKIITQGKDILGRVINQDTLDDTSESTNFAGNLYSFSDLVRDSDLELSDNILEIVKNTKKYNVEVLGKDELEEMLTDHVEDVIEERFGTAFKNNIQNQSKLLMQANYPMWLDSGGRIVTKKDDISYKGVTNLGLGNSVQGIQSLLFSLNKLLKDESIKNEIYDLIREAGNMLSISIKSGDSNLDIQDIMKKLVEDMEDHFTKGGAVYDSNPYYSTNNTEVYCDSDFRITSRELAPGNLQLLMRADRKNAIISDIDGKKVYPLELFLQNLKFINFQPDKARIEESLYDLINHDLLGRDRTSDPAAYPFSFLENLIFTTVVSSNFGWNNGGTTGEIISAKDPRSTNGHGECTGILSMNDCLFCVKTNRTFDAFGIPELTFRDSDQNHLFRSRKKFTVKNKDKFKFYFSEEYPATNFLSGACVGDLGDPNGGNPDGIIGEPTKNGYWPYEPTGIKEAGLGGFTMGWIIRACWNGEGPYYAKENMTQSGNEYTYYRPNGKVYAKVIKDDIYSPVTWEYNYPVDKGDKEDDESKGQRYNRFKSSWRSDYLLNVYTSDDYSLTNAGKKTSTEKYIAITNEPTGDTKMFELSSPNDSAGYNVYYELINENDAKRECETHEEALYRNFQWVMLEKKFIELIPMHLEIDKGSLKKAVKTLIGEGLLDAQLETPINIIIDILPIPLIQVGTTVLVVEGNGVAGLTSCRKFRENHVWAKSGKTGRSTIQGDYRNEVVAHPYGLSVSFGPSTKIDISNLLVNDKVVYNETLGVGTLVPAIIVQNAPVLYRLAFPLSKPVTRNTVNGEPIIDYQIGSKEFQVGDENWQQRNALVPILVSLVAGLREYTGTISSSNINAGIRTFLDGTAPLLKPLIYYQRYFADNFIPGAEYSSEENCPYPIKTWKPRLMDDHWFLKSNAEFYSYNSKGIPIGNGGMKKWYGGEEERAYYQPARLKTMLNMLIDSDPFSKDPKRCDGLLAFLTQYENGKAPNSRLLTRLFRVLLILAGEKYDDTVAINENDSNFEDWGPRRQIFYALEQLQSCNKPTKGEYNKINESNFKKLKYPQWMFATYDAEKKTYKDVRDVDVITDKGLDISIGSDELGMGLAVFPDERDPKHKGYKNKDWDGYYRNFKMLTAFMSKKGDTQNIYYILEEVITVLDKILAKISPTNDQLRALIHTGGIALTSYDSSLKTWKTYDEDLLKIVQEHMLKLEQVPQGHLLEANSRSITEMSEGGLFKYVIDTMTSDYSSESIIKDIYAFISKPPVSNYKSQFWDDVATLLEDTGDAIIDGQNFKPEEFFDNGFQYNGNFEK
ncbi:MAG: hypothetical protein HQK76_06045 [Desulfobacterales bacterium]|nr:hypothetical protein [Desulfobacterales bacterium]